jgi:hypothetical protein
MSQIASFYVLDKGLLPALIDSSAQKPVTKKNWLGKVTSYQNPYQDFIKNHIPETGGYQYSGGLYVTLYVYLKDKKGLDWAALELEKEGDQICANTGGSLFLFSYNDRQQLLPVLDTQQHDVRGLQRFAEEEFEDEQSDTGELLLETIKEFREKLLTLKEADILLLEIG